LLSEARLLTRAGRGSGRLHGTGSPPTNTAKTSNSGDASSQPRISYTSPMKLDLEIAWAFLKRRSGGLLRGTALAALFGIALATMALVITLALMEGYSNSISRALQRGNAHLVGFAPAGLKLDEAGKLAAEFETVSGVRRASPVVYLTALARDPKHPSRPLPIVIKGVSSPPAFTGIKQWPATEELTGCPGFELARHLGLQSGSFLDLQLPPARGSWIMPALRLKMLQSFRLDFSEFDRRWLVVPLDRLLAALPKHNVAGIEVVLDRPREVDAAREKLEALAPKLLFTDWREMNISLFSALKWQTISLFIVLSLVVAVASFQVSSALVVLSIDKRRSTGMLQAIGATPWRIRRILTMAGVMLGSGGLVLGMLAGAFVCRVLTLTRAVRFPEDLARIYLIDHVPFLLNGKNMAAIAGVCLLLIIVASVWPAYRSAKMEPARAIRAV